MYFCAPAGAPASSDSDIRLRREYRPASSLMFFRSGQGLKLVTIVAADALRGTGRTRSTTFTRVQGYTHRTLRSGPSPRGIVPRRNRCALCKQGFNQTSKTLWLRRLPVKHGKNLCQVPIIQYKQKKQRYTPYIYVYIDTPFLCPYLFTQASCDLIETLDIFDRYFTLFYPRRHHVQL